MKKLLLDENLPRQLKKHFSAGFEVIAVPDLGWQSKKNGELLAAMNKAGIEYLLTSDKSLRFKQNLEKFKVRVVILLAYDNRLKKIIRKISEIEAGINMTDEFQKIIEVDIRGT
jgi:predicted nuclease of predicted toxin-antitoxin system